MAYEKTEWQNGTGEPINADNLNKIEQGIEDAHTDILNLQTKTDDVVTQNVLDNYLMKRNIFVEKINIYSPDSGRFVLTPNAYKDTEDNIAKTNYTPIAISGVRISNSTEHGQNASAVVCSWGYISGNNLRLRIKNVSSSATAAVKVECWILYKVGD